MKQQIHINDQGELLLIEAPDKESYRYAGIADEATVEKHYRLALLEAIEKGIKFKPESVGGIVMIIGELDYANDEIVKDWLNDHQGESFDLPNPYTAEVKWYNPCIEHKKCLIADDQNRNNCAQLHGNKCQKEYRVAVLTPLKQEPKNQSR